MHLLIKTPVQLVSLGLQFGGENSLSTIGFLLQQSELAHFLTSTRKLKYFPTNDSLFLCFSALSEHFLM